jgi:hypothetical protein
LSIGLALAGCVDPQNDSAAAKDLAGRRGTMGTEDLMSFLPDWPELALPGGHNHKDPTIHQNLSTPNFAIQGYEPLITDYYGKTSGDYLCGDLKEHEGRALSVTHSFGSDIAFVIVDVTDSSAPKKIGELVMANTHVYDLGMTEDQQFVVLATSPYDVGPDVTQLGVPPYAEFRDACSGETRPVKGPEAGLPYSAGVTLVDISNPRAPIVVDFLMFPVFGGHSIQTSKINGANLVLTAVSNLAGPASYYVLMEIQELPIGPKLVPRSVYQYTGGAPGENVGANHDGYLAKHPVTGENLAYLAYGNVGFVILNIDDPSNPVVLSHWNRWSEIGDRAPPSLFIHEVLPTPTLWNGKHYTFMGEECGSHPVDRPSCLVVVLDTTDPRNPKHVGAWTLPADVEWTTLFEFSLHYLTLVERTLFVSAWHGGVWAVDVSTDEALSTMPSIGVFMPANVSPSKFDFPPRSAVIQGRWGGYALEDTPVILDLNSKSDGTLVVYDSLSGLYTVRFDATHPAPAPAPWPLSNP